MKLKFIPNIFFASLMGLGLNAMTVAAESSSQPAKQEVTSPVKRKVESLTLTGVAMKEAAHLITVATKTPIIVSTEAAKVLVDVHLRDVTAEMALKAICQSSGLWYQKNEKDGLLHVMTTNEFKNTLQFDRSEKVEVVQILYPSAKDIGDALAKLYIDRVIWLDPRKNSGDRYSEVSKALRRMDLLGERGTFEITDDENSSSSDSDDDDDNEDNEDNEKKNDVEKAMMVDLNKLDANRLQQMLKMGNQQSQKDLKLTNLMNTPGVVFISVLPENNSLMLRSNDASAVEDMLKLIKKLDKPTPQVLLEVKVLSVLLDDSRERSIDFLFGANDGSYSGGFANGSMSSSGSEILKPSSYDSSTGAGLLQQGSGINSSAAIFSAISSNFKARVQMLESNERVTSLATPNLIVCNNESSTIFIGTETTVMEKAQSTTTYKETSSGGTQPVVSWEIEAPRQKVGVSLVLTPKIHADRTVTLRLLQEKSSLGQQVKNVYSGGTANSSTEEQYFITQDVDLQRLVTTVVGSDRQFMVIGGLVQESVGKTTEKIPLLCEIPYLGEWLFTRMSATRERREILIIIRPFVMSAPGEAQVISQEYLDKMSQHPVAKEDLPSLGVGTPDELAKSKVINPNDPWLIRMLDKLRGWQVDDDSEFNVEEQLNRQTRRENHQEALKEIKRIQENAQ